MFCNLCVWEVRLRPADCHVCTCYFGLHGNCLSHANHQGCFAGTGAIVRLPQCQWSKPDGYGKISQCITTTKHSKAKTVCIFLGIYCTWKLSVSWKSPVQMQENEIMIKTEKEHTAGNKFSLQLCCVCKYCSLFGMLKPRGMRKVSDIFQTTFSSACC